ncbi:MAG: DedA family protein [Deltaproteobacteria bacterium]|jgi:membrane-associated protein|nr:DedA family protein [Deltaproteobacteria bacterium]
METPAPVPGLLSQLAEALGFILDLALHVDRYLFPLAETYGFWIYPLLFLVIFCETGLVITPFLPGDSLLFAAGALSGAGKLSYPLLLPLIFCAAVAGDQLNYFAGRHIGQAAFERERRFLKREYLLRAQAFYTKHGGKAIVLARFVPIIRTFAPFVAGIARMRRQSFILFNCCGAAVWVLTLISAGFFLGNLPWVQKNFSVVIYAIILISLAPVLVEGLRNRRREKT